MSTRAPSGIIPLVFDYKVVEFDPEEFDVAIRGAGVGFVHYRAMKCPVGIVDRDDSRRPHEDHSGCFNRVFFTRAAPLPPFSLATTIVPMGMKSVLLMGHLYKLPPLERTTIQKKKFR